VIGPVGARTLPAEGVGPILAEVARLRAAGRDVIPFHVGEPEMPTPLNIVEAGVRALRAGHTHYTPTLGLPALREAIADTVAVSRGISVVADQVIVTPGAKMALHLLALALIGPGDEVVCTDPAYGAYAALGTLAGAIVRAVPQRIEDGFRLDLDELERTLSDRTRILFLNSPANPTGRVLDDHDLRGIAELVERRPRLIVVSDEIYSQIVYAPARPSSPAALRGLTDRVVIVDGMSKTYAMTGWRVGYAVAPRALVDELGRLALHTFFCVSSVAQWAAVEALRGPQYSVTEMVATYRRRRSLMIDGINRIPGLRCLAPDGAFYAFVDTRSLGLDSVRLSQLLLSDGGVATYPGSAFGAAGEGFVRLSFATSDDAINEGIRRIALTLDALARSGSAATATRLVHERGA
jgi:aspartate aminotransferase